MNVTPPPPAPSTSTTHRLAVRWSEDASLLSALDPALLLGEKGRFYRQEQTILTDTLFSCMAGRPVHRAIMYEVRRDDAWAKIGGKEVRRHMCGGGAAAGEGQFVSVNIGGRRPWKAVCMDGRWV